MTRDKLLAPATVKAGEDQGLGSGEFEAIVSVFGNTDSMGDRVMPGAFAKTLEEWAERGKPMPVVWTHNHGDLFSHVGHVLDAQERDEGLWIKGVLDDLDDPDNREGRKLYRLLKGDRIDNWSFAYDVRSEGPGDDGVNELRELGVYEVGPTLIGANQSTRTLAVKADTKETVSDKPWSDFPDSAFDDDQYARACILDRGADAGTAKQRYGLPVREPDGTLNRNACHNAASVLGGGRGGVQASDEAKATAARKLVRLYRAQLDEEPPEDVAELAKAQHSTDAKAGRVLSKKNEDALRQAADLITGVLSALDERGEADNDGKAKAGEPVKDEDHNGKSEEPMRPTSADLSALQSIELAAL